MTPQEHLLDGDLTATLAALQGEVRSNPGDAKLRIFLFQLLCVLGDWKRAVTQLKLCADLDPAAIPMAQTYREAIICEVFRDKVFAGLKDPLIFGEPPEWVALMIEANRMMGQGNTAQAEDLRGRAFDKVPDAPGKINGTAFEWIADADMRLGPLLEIIINGKYYWMPFSNIHTLKVDAPEDLRDAVWTAAQVKLHNGGEFVALIPTRYAGTAQSGDHAAMLARSTSWVQQGDNTFIGTGQRLFTLGEQDIALMDLRELTLDSADG